MDQILAFGLGDERLELGSRESVDKTGLRNDQQENLGSGEDRKFIRLLHDTRLPLRECDVTTRFVLDELDFNLSSFSSSLFIIVIVVVSCHGGSRTLSTSGVDAVAGQFIAR